MYNLMIADDEIDKLEYLRNYNWADFDININCEARDGIEAYNMLVEHNPDICMIDIQMPGMDGLQAIGSAKSMGIKTKFIIISGYDKFSYAQKALSLSTVEYLLKPCRPSDIRQAVMKCVKMIEEETAQDELYKPLLLEHLISGNVSDEEISKPKIYQHGLEFLLNSYAVCVVKTNHYNIAVDYPNLCREIRAVYAEKFKYSTVLYGNQIVLIISMENIAQEFSAFYQGLIHIVSYFKNKNNINCLVGVSDIKEQILLLHTAYKEALDTGDASSFILNKNITFYAELCSCTSSYPVECAMKVVSSLELDEEHVRDAVDAFFNACAIKTNNLATHFRNMAILLIYDVVKTSMDKSLNAGTGIVQTEVVIQEILHADDLLSIKQIVTDFVLAFVQHSDTISAIVKRCLSYIQNNYSRKVSLDSVAEAMYVTPSYLSTLFKMQTGLNLIDYLNRYRINKSKQLLSATNDKIYEIAYKVGFQDDKYFCMLFKRYTEITAAEYRKRHLM